MLANMTLALHKLIRLTMTKKGPRCNTKYQFKYTITPVRNLEIY